MDDKAITAVHIQVNALPPLPRSAASHSCETDHFHRLVSQGLQAIGLETMDGMKSRIRERILQQEKTALGSNGNGQA